MPAPQRVRRASTFARSPMQARLLQFCTGSTRVPIEGFQNLQGSDGPRQFCIQKVGRRAAREAADAAQIDDGLRLPSAHTCFNRLDLPVYSSGDILARRLVAAMENAQGFSGD